MDEKSAPEWILEIQGGQSGPYTLEQVRGFLNAGEISQATRVASKDLPGRWMTVQELLRSHHAKTPKPPEIRPDVTESLFDTLQAAKDRKAAKQAATPPAQSAVPQPSRSGTSRLLLAAVVLALAGAAAWAFFSHPGGKSQSEGNGFLNPIAATPLKAEPETTAAHVPPPPRPPKPLTGSGGFGSMSFKANTPALHHEAGLAPAPPPAAPPPPPPPAYTRGAEPPPGESAENDNRDDRYRDEMAQDTVDSREAVPIPPPPPPPAIQTPYPDQQQPGDENRGDSVAPPPPPPITE